MDSLTLEKRTAIREDWQRTRRNSAAAISTFVFLGLLAFLSVFQLQPPSDVPADAPAIEFSSGRAVEYLKVIAARPHPTGSAANDAVREYLLKQLTALGLNAEVQTATAVRYDAKWRGPAVAATVHNVLARLKGTAHTKAVLLAAHYDSVPNGPGASDDGSGTATLLETARALKAGPPLANDVMFLFTDGEELGLLGAQAFVDEHPWAKDAGVVLNFEARGACGPVSMFETSQNNGWLIREFAKAAPHALASSLMFEAYKRLPNDTDLTIFKRAGLAGLNFAYVGCWPRYHTMGDSFQNLDERSLEHDGSYALPLARHFGNLDLSNPIERDAVYFTLFGATIHYSQLWSLPLTILAVLCFSGVLVIGVRKGRLTARGISFGFLIWPLAAFAASLVPETLWIALRGTRFVSLLPYGMAYNGQLYAVGFMALALAVFLAAYLWAGKKTSIENLTAGVLAWWAVLAALGSLLAPGATYVLVWPLIAATGALACELLLSNRPTELARALVWAVPAAAGLLLFGPLPYLLLQLLSTGGLVVIVVALALLLGFLLPHLRVIMSQRKWPLPAGALALALVFIASAMATSGYDSRHARPDNIFYWQDADAGKAFWASSDSAPDDWTRQFFTGPIGVANLGQFLPLHAPLRQSPAPPVSLPPPEVKVLNDASVGEERLLLLSITSPRGARAVWVAVTKGEVLGGSVNGKLIQDSPLVARQGVWGLAYVGIPEDGLTLGLHVVASQPLALQVTDESDGLPAFQGISFTPRPDTFMPVPGPFDSSTLVSKTFVFKSKH